MVHIHRFDDGKRAVLSVNKDTDLYSSPRNPPNTGSRYTEGSDLHVHKTKNHGLVFYKYNWSMWQGTESYYEVISKDEAIEFLESVVGDYYGFPDKSDIETLKEFDLDITEETA